MKFRCEREQLAEALGLASRIASGRVGALPALSGVRLQVKRHVIASNTCNRWRERWRCAH